MKYFTFIKKDTIHVAEDQKIIPASEFSTLVEAHKVLEQAKGEAVQYRAEVAKECEQLKEEAKKAGFEEGLKQWNKQLALLEKETASVHQEMEETVVPLALTAIKKIIGHELKQKPATIVDIVSTSLKGLSQHHKISIYVNKVDLEIVEASRDRLKAIFEHLDRLTITFREDVEPGGCIIETEVGIINAQLDSQLKALEVAFHTFLHKQKKKESTTKQKKKES